MSVEKELEATVARALERVVQPLVRRLDRLEQLAARKKGDKILWTESEVATMLGVAAATLKKWRVHGKVKAHTPIGARRPLYRWKDIEQIASQLANGDLNTSSTIA